MKNAWIKALSIYVMCGIAGLGATTYDWNLDGNGSWSTPANWNPPTSFPNSSSDNAIFTTTYTIPVTVGLLSQYAVNGVSITSSSPYIFTNTGAGQLAFEGAGASLTVLSGAQQFQVPISLGANFIIQQSSSSPLVISSVISETTPITLTYLGPNETILSGNNSFNALSITGGTLTVSNEANLGSAGTNTFLNGGTIHTTDTTTFSKNYTLGNTTSGIQTDSGTTLTMNGSLNQTAGGMAVLNKEGGGNLILNIASINTLNIVDGDLIANGDILSPISTTNIQAAGTLSGSGIVNGTVNNSGFIIPETPSGFAFIMGNYRQTSAGTLQINYTNPQTFTELNVDGTASLAGDLLITLPTTFSFPLLPASPIRILNATNGRSGEFDQVFIPSQYVATVSYNDPNSVFLLITPAMGATQTRSINNSHQVKVASENNSFYFLTTQMQRMQRVMRRKDIAENAPAVATRTLNPSLLTADNSEGVAAPQLGVIAADSFLTQDKQQQLKRTLEDPQTQYPAHFYAGPLGGTGRADGVDFWSAGALMGFDYAFSQVGLGLMVKYNHISGQGFIVDESKAKLYATYVPEQLPQIAVNAIVGYDHDWVYFHTRKGFTGDLHTAKGTPQSNEYNALLGIEYALEKSQISGLPSGLQISPLAALQYTHNHMQKYQEHGAGLFDQEFTSLNVQTLRLSLEVITYYTKTWNNFTFSPQVMIGWQREFLAKGNEIGSRGVGSDDPYMYSDLPSSGRNFAVAGVDLQFYFFEQYGIETSWNFEWNSLYYDNQFYLGFNYLF